MQETDLTGVIRNGRSINFAPVLVTADALRAMQLSLCRCRRISCAGAD
jgi:hypothetical protein